ncbi:MAG: FtsX-like permease family protein [Anaerolineae bacterium]|nr:FtsX-like permease family protein [Anaerolineae bacterium]
MGFLNRFRAIIVIVVKRLTSQPWLVIATTLGLVVAIGLMMSIPIYADAVYHRVFLRSIAPEGALDGVAPPFPFLFRYDGSIYGSKDWEEVAAVDAYLSNEASLAFGLPEQLVVRYATTDPYGIFAGDTTNFDNIVSPLVWAGFSFISDLSDHVTMLEGQFPEPVSPEAGAALEVMIHEELATEIGAQVGEGYVAYLRIRSDEGFIKNLQFPVRIAGVWTPKDPDEAFWFFRPSAFRERLLVPEESFQGYVGAQMDGEVYTAAWYLIMDGQEITHTDAGGLIRRTLAVEQHAASLLTDTTLGESPLNALVDYRRSANLLTILLYAFSIPILGLLLAFITLTAGLSTERRRNEVAVLRSRGAMALQMVGIAALESLLLGAVALAISSPAGMAIAQLIGRTRSFLDFAAEVDALRVTVTMNTLRFGMVAVAVGLVAQVVPTLGAAGHTIVSYKREQARILKKPWWQRAWLDVLLFIPAGYGAYLLRNQGSVVVLEENFGGSPFENPLLFLVPALGIFALTLFFLRLMPLIMSAVAWIAARTKSVGLLMAARHLARTPGSYSTPLILLVLTLSLSAFTASLAYTLDQHLYDMTYYQGGADMRFFDRGEGQDTGLAGFFGGASDDGDTETADEGPRWLFRPVTDYLNSPGVEAATRVARYPAYANVSVGSQEGVYLGVERAALSNISYWRNDFAQQSLGALMNALALERNGVLVAEDFLRESILNVGDTMPLQVSAYGERTQMDMRIVGSFRYFPTWYPSEGPLFIGNLDYFHEQAGQQFPYNVWMSLSSAADVQGLVDEDLDLTVSDWTAPKLTMAEEQEAPERQGLFGLLSVGFGAAAILTVMGFLLYALFSFRRRFIEFGVLRAVGLSSRQMASFLGWELALLILMGGGLGTLLGGWVSAFFIPFLQIGADEVSRIPPYVVDIAWSAIFRIYALFGLLFVVAFAALIVMLRRMRIFEAVKLGETA